MEDNKLIIYKNSAGNIVVDAIYADDGKNYGEYGRTSRRGFAGAACYR